MSPTEDERPWPKTSLRLPSLRTLVVTALLLVIALNELQRTLAQASAHRERLEQTLTMARIERKLDWLLYSFPPLPTRTATSAKLNGSVPAGGR